MPRTTKDRGRSFEPDAAQAPREDGAAAVEFALDRRAARHARVRHDGVRPRLLAAAEPARRDPRGRARRRRRRRRRRRSPTPWSAPRPARSPPGSAASHDHAGRRCPEPRTPGARSTSRSRWRSINAACRRGIQADLRDRHPVAALVHPRTRRSKGPSDATGLIQVGGSARHRANEESGAVAVIVALSLIAIFAMLVLTVDVGGLLLDAPRHGERRRRRRARRRPVVRRAPRTPSTPRPQADTYATAERRRVRDRHDEHHRDRRL